MSGGRVFLTGNTQPRHNELKKVGGVGSVESVAN